VPPGETPPDGEAVDRGRVCINDTQYIDGGEPDVWALPIGGYPVCKKGLKDRKGHALSFADLRRYQSIVVLRRTQTRMDAIDARIDVHGGWPLAGAGPGARASARQKGPDVTIGGGSCIDAAENHSSEPRTPAGRPSRTRATAAPLLVP
jgi:hypothetical protein